MKRRIVSLLLALCLLCALLSGCSLFHKHVWAEATCTEPETCAECGKTQGEPLGQEWAEATCTEPRTCARCGATEGEALGHDAPEATCTEAAVCARCGETVEEALGHDWIEATCTEAAVCARCGETDGEPLGHSPTEADYWSPSVCSRCGEEMGPILTPDFETYGLKCGMKLGKTYDYLTCCYEDRSKSTVAKAEIAAYSVVKTAEDYEAVPGVFWDLAARDGWEWRIVKVKVTFSDYNAVHYGWSVSPCFENYYDIVNNDENEVWYDEGESDEGYAATYRIVYKGETYDCNVMNSRSNTGWVGDQVVWTECRAYQVPVGYDGFVYGLHNSGVPWEDGQYIYDVADKDSLFFRLS